jgi:hypothetical protein
MCFCRFCAAGVYAVYNVSEVTLSGCCLESVVATGLADAESGCSAKAH